MQDFPLLGLNLTVENLAKQFLTLSNLPPKAANDALHIALAIVYGLDDLLTWNCKHIYGSYLILVPYQNNWVTQPHLLRRNIFGSLLKYWLQKQLLTSNF
ncbi:MAG: type II toxin-antitoxin system VapC family toxin [Okeania sp. SIO2C2]|nr:type II toxin-antitoxin system VapC family toxin [Okeania sp. SIO2C2]